VNAIIDGFLEVNPDIASRLQLRALGSPRLDALTFIDVMDALGFQSPNT
jgi:hypothetical protein